MILIRPGGASGRFWSVYPILMNIFRAGVIFLNGAIDSRQGTCANMAALHVALGWRLGWNVSLALAGWHVFCRYDDGERIHNIEATKNGQGGFHSHPDEYYQKQHRIPDRPLQQGSEQ
jgi:hypothetical protein